MREQVRQWLSIAEKWSRQTGVPAALILAVIEQESGGNPYAERYEKEYEARYVTNSGKNARIALECGLTRQQVATSYGLMQLMFPLAYGYGARSIEDLHDPDKNIRFGAAHLKTLMSKHCAGNIDDVCIRKIAGAYNGAGSGSSYARNVYSLYLRYESWIKGMRGNNSPLIRN